MADKKHILKGLDHFLTHLPIGASVKVDVTFIGGNGDQKMRKKSSKSATQYKIKDNRSVLDHSALSMCDSDDAYSIELRTDRLFPLAHMVTSSGGCVTKKKNSISDL